MTPEPAKRRKGTVNGEPYDVPHGYQVIADDAFSRLAAFATIVSDLDRCEHGRHEGDVCQCPSGSSHGNPVKLETLGYTMSGDRIADPGRSKRHIPEAWITARGAAGSLP